MIKNISFTGKLEIAKPINKACSRQDIKALQTYADKLNGDVFIENAAQYKTGEMVYKGYAIINHTIYDITFDTKNPFKNKKSRTEMPPEYY